jgi:DNA-binding PadR family transcriptional regulator
MLRIMNATTTLGFALLGLLHKHPASGYDLRKTFQSTPMAHYSSSPGAIYPALRRLEQRGLITGSVERRQTLRPRKTFKPTRRGSRALESWLDQPVSRDDVAFRLDELLLRFAFMANRPGPDRTRGFLKDLTRELDRYIEDLQRELEALPPGPPPHPRLAVECGIESYRAHARWARRALRNFESIEKTRDA